MKECCVHFFFVSGANRFQRANHWQHTDEIQALMPSLHCTKGCCSISLTAPEHSFIQEESVPIVLTTALVERILPSIAYHQAIDDTLPFLRKLGADHKLVLLFFHGVTYIRRDLAAGCVERPAGARPDCLKGGGMDESSTSVSGGMSPNDQRTIEPLGWHQEVGHSEPHTTRMRLGKDK